MAYKSIGTRVAVSNNVSNPTNLSPGLPTRADEDLLIAVSTCRSITATPTCATAGWAIWPGFPKKSATASGGQIAVFYADGLAGAPTITWTGVATGTTGDSSQAVIVCLNNMDTVSPQDVTAPAANDASAAAPTIPAISGMSSFSTAIAIAMKVIDSATTGTVPVYTERGDFHTTSGTGHHLYIATQDNGSGTYNNGATPVTTSPTTTARCLAVVLAVKQRAPIQFPRTATDSWTVSDSATRIENPSYETIIDDFNRADGPANAGGPWVLSHPTVTAPTDLRVTTNQLGGLTGSINAGYTTVEIEGDDFDVLIDCTALPAVGGTLDLYAPLTNPGQDFASYYLSVQYNGTGNGTVYLGTKTETLDTQGFNGFSVGDKYWLSKRGTALKVFRSTGGGNFVLLLSATDSSHNPVSGVIGVVMSDTTQRWDNLRGGPLAAAVPQTYPRTASDSWSVSDSADRAPATRVRTAVDSIAVSDSTIRAGGAQARTAADTWSTNDSAAGIATVGVPSRTATDSWSVSDSVTRGPLPPGFSPSALTGLAMWLDAPQLGLSNGAAVTSWTDSSGLGRDMTGGNPTFQTNALNGLPVVRFDGIDDMLTGPSLAALAAGEVFIVVKVANDPPGPGDSSTGLWAMGAPWTHTHFPYTDSIVYEMFGTEERKVYNPPSLAVWNVYNVRSAPSAWSAHLNGVELHATTTNTKHFPAAPRLGRGANSYYLDGYVAEFILYDRVLTTPERAQVEKYLDDKWFGPGLPPAGGPMFTRTAFDTVAFSDSAAAPTTRIRPVTDAVAFSDVATRAPGARARGATDSWARSDTATRSAATLIRPAADVVTFSDVALRAATARVRGAVDGISFDDSAIGAAQTTKIATASDSWTVIDIGIRASIVRTRTAVDAVVVSDSTTRMVKRTITAVDNIGVSDAVVGQKVSIRTASDAWSTSDTAGRVGGIKPRTAADSWTRSDTANRAASTWLRGASDAVTLSDTLSRTPSSRVRTAVDSWSTSDTVSAIKIGGTGAAAYDTVVTFDVAARAPTAKPRTATDIVAFSDTSTRVALHPGRTAIDNWSLSDWATVKQSLKRPTADAFSVTDTVSRGSTRQRQTVDTFIISDTAQRKVSDSRFTADSWSSSDTVRASGSRARIIVDIIVISDVAGAVMRAGAAPQMTMML